MTYFLTPQAYHDLENIHDFIADDKPTRALVFINLIEKKCELLAKNPSIGKSRTELSVGLLCNFLPTKQKK